MSPGQSPWRAVGRGLRAAWDHAGATLTLSVLWCAAALLAALGGWGGGLAIQGERGRVLAGWLLEGRGAPPGHLPGDPGRFLLAALLPLALWVFGVAPLTAGVCAYCRDVVGHESPAWTDMSGLVRSHYGRAAGLGALQASVSVLLLSDVLFFLSRSAFGPKLLGILFLYLLLFWLAAQPYQWPLLVAQRPSALSAVKKSALLVLDNIGFTVVVSLVAILVSVGCLLIGIGIPLLWSGTLAFLYTEATRALLRKYGVLPPEPEADDGTEGAE